MIDEREREAMIQEMVDRSNLMREDAEAAVARYLGESEGDIVATRPLTPEERRRIGLGLTMEEAHERMLQRAQELARIKSSA